MGCKFKEIRKSKFVAKAQFLYRVSKLFNVGKKAISFNCCLCTSITFVQIRHADLKGVEFLPQTQIL